jgi:CBS domain-containing protein
MKLRDIMRRNPQTIAPDERLLYAREMMLWGQLHHLPVVAAGKLVGIISDHDIAAHQARSGRGLASSDDTVAKVMNSEPKTAHPDDSLTEAVGRLGASRIGCLPVVEQGHLLGIVTTTDVLAAEVRRSMTPPSGPYVAEVMTTDVLTIHPDDRVLDAAARMQVNRIRHLPVVDSEGEVIGMLSDRDIRTAVGDPLTAFDRDGGGPDFDALRVGQAMSAPAITTTPQESCAAASRAFIAHSASALPVVDDGRLVGIVSYIDLLRVLAT